MRDDERSGRSKEVNTPELIGQRVRVRVTIVTWYPPEREEIRLLQFLVLELASRPILTVNREIKKCGSGYLYSVTSLGSPDKGRKKVLFTQPLRSGRI